MFSIKLLYPAIALYIFWRRPPLNVIACYLKHWFLPFDGCGPEINKICIFKILIHGFKNYLCNTNACLPSHLLPHTSTKQHVFLKLSWLIVVETDFLIFLNEIKSFIFTSHPTWPHVILFLAFS